MDNPIINDIINDLIIVMVKGIFTGIRVIIAMVCLYCIHILVDWYLSKNMLI